MLWEMQERFVWLIVLMIVWEMTITLNTCNVSTFDITIYCVNLSTSTFLGVNIAPRKHKTVLFAKNDNSNPRFLLVKYTLKVFSF